MMEIVGIALFVILGFGVVAVVVFWEKLLDNMNWPEYPDTESKLYWIRICEMFVRKRSEEK